MHHDPSDPPVPSQPAATTPPPPATPRRAVGPLGWLIRYTRGLIVDQQLRRLTMFYVIIAAMLMAFGGEIVLGTWLRENPWRFLGYYFVCAWLTVVAALLALYDLLMIRLQHRVIRRRLRTDLLGDEHKDDE